MEHSIYRGVQIMRAFEEPRPWWAEVKGCIASSATLAGLKRTIRDLSNAPTLNWRELTQARGETA